jgi:mRNA-degrading endonuclease toxin of MazEF toxin-antitoxin module
VQRLQQGCIVRASVLDPAGANRKIRPLVIVTANSEIRTAPRLIAVAITGSFSDPPADDEVPLPWHSRGGSRTNLTKPCVAKCSWVRELLPTDVIEVRGHVPTALMESILERVAKG